MSYVCVYCLSGLVSCILFFFSSRRRHTRCALVTGVQTCALPIYDHARVAFTDIHPDERSPSACQFLQDAVAYYAALGVTIKRLLTDNGRSEERRGGKEGVSKGRTWWWRYHYKKKQHNREPKQRYKTNTSKEQKWNIT